MCFLCIEDIELQINRNNRGNNNTFQHERTIVGKLITYYNKKSQRFGFKF